MLSDYTNKAGELVKHIAVATDGRPWLWFAPECERFVAFAKEYGAENVKAVIDGFVAGQEYQAGNTFTYETFKKVRMLVLRTSPDDKRPMSKASGGWAGVSTMIGAYGVPALVSACEAVIAHKEGRAPKPTVSDPLPRAEKGVREYVDELGRVESEIADLEARLHDLKCRQNELYAVVQIMSE